MAGMNQSPSDRETPKLEAVKLVYQELCNSYRSIEIFRAQLLGFLPLLSGAGIFFLLNDTFTDPVKKSFADQYVGPIGIFGCAVTLGLFFYELRGIWNCYSLIIAGKALEKDLCINGQFLHYVRPILGIIGMRLAACTIYSAVLAAWVFVALVPLRTQKIFWIALVVFFVSLASSLLLVRQASTR